MLVESTTDDVDGDEQREDDDDPNDPEPGPQRRRGSLTIEINLDADDPPPSCPARANSSVAKLPAALAPMTTVLTASPSQTAALRYDVAIEPLR